MTTALAEMLSRQTSLGAQNARCTCSISPGRMHVNQAQGQASNPGALFFPNGGETFDAIQARSSYFMRSSNRIS